LEHIRLLLFWLRLSCLYGVWGVTGAYQQEEKQSSTVFVGREKEFDHFMYLDYGVSWLYGFLVGNGTT